MAYHDVIAATSGLVGYWKLDDSSGAAVDSSGGGRDLTYSGSPSYGAAAIVPGYLSTSFGGSAYATYGGVPTTATDNWTIECWCSMTHPGQKGMMFVGSDSSNGYGMCVGSVFGSSSGLFSLFGGVVWGDPSYNFSGSPFTGHVVITRRSGSTRVYINGSNVGTPFSSTPNAPSSTMTIGRTGAGNGMNFNGRIAHVAVYNASVSDSDILAHYNAGIAAASVPIPVASQSYRQRRS